MEEAAVGSSGLESIAVVSHAELADAAEGLVVEGNVGGRTVVRYAGAAIGAGTACRVWRMRYVDVSFHVGVGGVDGYHPYPIAVAVGVIGCEAADVCLCVGVAGVIGIDQDDGTDGHVLPDGVVGEADMSESYAAAREGAVIGARAVHELAVVVVYNPAAQVHGGTGVSDDDQFGVFFTPIGALRNFIDHQTGLSLAGFRQIEKEECEKNAARVHQERGCLCSFWEVLCRGKNVLKDTKNAGHGGLYVYRFRYWNSLALQEEEVSGQVVLLR